MVSKYVCALAKSALQQLSYTVAARTHPLTQPVRTQYPFCYYATLHPKKDRQRPTYPTQAGGGIHTLSAPQYNPTMQHTTQRGRLCGTKTSNIQIQTQLNTIGLNTRDGDSATVFFWYFRTTKRMVELSGLAKSCVQAQLISQEEAIEYQQNVLNKKISLATQLLGNSKIPKKSLALELAKAFGCPCFDLSALDKNHIKPDFLQQKFVKEYGVLPLMARGQRLIIAVADPSNRNMANNIALQAKMTIDMIVVDVDQLSAMVAELTGEKSTSSTDVKSIDNQDMIDSLTTPPNSYEESSQSTLSAEVDEAPIVRFIQKILLQAIEQGASDIHFEPYEKVYRVRFRIDGMLKEIATPPLEIKEVVSARIKVISRLDISEKRLPQDGRTRLQVSPTRTIDFRVSALPTLFGEKIAMRILDPHNTTLGIEELGYDSKQAKDLLLAIKRPYGMVLVTGPTGSGKTVSLYTCLHILNVEGTNISTAEDPAEMNLSGINQVNVNDRIGLSFAVALRSFLRQDPDVIMVGEIRDLETAEIAIKAAQTGHMVLSTLHTNDAPSTLTRLMNMGIPNYNIASTVSLITAQRLARLLCVKCKKPITIPKEVLIQAGFEETQLTGDWQPYQPVGCEACDGKGYKGRVGIYQVMPITKSIEEIILREGSSLEIARQAREDNINDLRRSGLNKVQAGVTSLEEIMGCTNE